ncbi:MAG: MurR/RpiR family transcriptional regulator [Plesiomonas sp.]
MPASHPILNNTRILTHLKMINSELTPSAKRLADAIIHAPEQATHSSVSQLSLCAKVGEASVIRFCRALGFKGFQEFKVALAVEIANKNRNITPLLSQEVELDDPTDLIANKLKNNLIQVLDETIERLDYSAICHVVDRIVNCRDICFFGVGSSGITAEEAKNKLMRIGYRSEAITNNHFMYMRASLLCEQDIAIAISHSGNSPETIKALRLAKEAGAFTVAITQNTFSAICTYADCILNNGNQENFLQGDSIGTKLSQLFIIDLLYTLLVQAKPDSAREFKLKTTRSLE